MTANVVASVKGRLRNKARPDGGKHRPYPAYRPSGVEWLSDMPAHWEVRRLKSICRFAYGDSLPAGSRANENILAYGSNGSVGFHSYPNTNGPCLIIGRKGSFGKVHYSSSPVFAIDTTFYVDSRKTDADIRWLYYLLKSLQLDAISRDSAVPGLSRDDAYQQISLYPPLAEQRAIAAFLARETTKIDALVSKKERLIELLREKRTALISRAVTKGLDPNAPMKDSGVEWLGEIPLHWEVQRLRYLANIKTGDRDTVDQLDGGKYPFFVRSQTVERIDSWSFDGEAVLTAGDGVGVGKVFHYVNGKFDYHQRVYKFSEFNSVTGKFFFQYFKAMLRFEVLQGTAKSTVDSLRLPMLQDFPVVMPSSAEQHAIVAFLDRETAKLDSLVAKVHQAIKLLKEKRTALISAAVTGQIDVREEAQCT